MVFINGGAFLTGDGGSPRSDPYDGSYMAARGNVIIVTFNYRLGALGGLVDPRNGITDNTNYNFGFRDQILALNWVKSNIGSFAGDPSNVTIFGQSAGAMSVGLHVLSSTQSPGLFKAALMESNPLGLPYKNMTEAAALGQDFTRTVMLCNGLLQPAASCMNDKTACDLVKGEKSAVMAVATFLSRQAQDLLAWAPALDDPQNPLPNALLKGQPLAAASTLGTPILLGTNRDEGHFFVEQYFSNHPLNPTLYASILDLTFGAKAGVVNGANSPYACKTGDCSTAMSNVITDYAFTCANRYFAQKAAAAQTTPRLYIYQFTEETANVQCSSSPASFNCAGPDSEVCHNNELIYVFNTAANYKGCFFEGGESNVSNAMVDYWTSFATSQTPGTLLRSWPSAWPLFQSTPRVSATNALYLQISGSPIVASDPLDASAHCSGFWDSIGYEVPTGAWSRLLADPK